MGNKIDSSTSMQSNTTMGTNNKVAIYVGIGASDTVGVGTPNPWKDGWVPQFASLINAEKTINLGRSGSTLADAMREQLPKVLDKKPDVVTIWLAVNDFNRQVYDTSMLTSYKVRLIQNYSRFLF
jgi:lysophospholipase L1-like esterase